MLVCSDNLVVGALVSEGAVVDPLIAAVAIREVAEMGNEYPLL